MTQLRAATLDTISVLAKILQEHRAASVELLLPQASLTRAARLLMAAASMTRAEHLGPGIDPTVCAESLAAAFERDAALLRGIVNDYGVSADPSPES
jgi:hypothetical protein